jgi:hypothetical protein
MSKIENILYKALEKGIYEQTMSIAQDIKKESPMMEVGDRYELAYEKANNKRKAFPPIN